MILDIINLSKEINNYIKNSYEKYIRRFRKVNILDAVIFRLLLSNNGSIQDDVTIKINKYNKKKCCRSSYADKENKLDLNFYKGINNIIDNYIRKTYKNVTQIVAVDGTYINILNNIKEFKADNNKLNVTPLISGIYNVTYKFPESLDIVTHKNEKKAFKEEYMNHNLYKNCIYVFDRGYQSNEFFKTLHLNNIKYICRIRKNTKIINQYNEDSVIKITIDGININLRNINYNINDNRYFILSNLMDNKEYTVDKIKQFYHNRWDIEEYFKYLKKYHNIEHLTNDNINKIYKSIYASLITSKIIFILASIKEKKTTKKINKSILVKGFYDNFIYKFIYFKGFNYKFMSNFMSTYAILRKCYPNRKYPHVCKRTTGKWYPKQHVRQNKQDKINNLNKKDNIDEKINHKKYEVKINDYDDNVKLNVTTNKTNNKLKRTIGKIIHKILNETNNSTNS